MTVHVPALLVAAPTPAPPVETGPLADWDEDLVRAEFDAIVAASWDGEEPGSPGPPSEALPPRRRPPAPGRPSRDAAGPLVQEAVRVDGSAVRRERSPPSAARADTRPQGRRPTAPPPFPSEPGMPSTPRPARRDPYAVLGLPRGASAEEVVRAFRRLVREHHPDVATSGAPDGERLREVVSAYEQLRGTTEPPRPAPAPPTVPRPDDVPLLRLGPVRRHR